MQHRGPRWAAFVAFVAITALLGRLITCSRGETFWLLFPVWVLAGSRGLGLFPAPRPLARSRTGLWLTRAALVALPLGLLAGLTWLLRGRLDLREAVLAVYFFAVSLESFLVYLFRGAEWLAGVVGRGRGQAAQVAARVGIKAILYALLIPFLLAVFSLHRVKIPPGEPDPALGVKWEPVSFQSSGGEPLALQGWFLPREKPVGTVLACHGVGANRGDLLEIAWILGKQGFQVLLFDFRGHGASEGHTVTYGAREREDVLGAWRYLRSRPDVDPDRLYALGVSMGGASLLLALGELEGVKAAVVDSAFADLDTMALHQYRYLPAPAARAMASLTSFFGWVAVGVHTSEVSPARALETLSIPLLFIHGTEDYIVPPESSVRLHAAYQGPRKLHLVEGAGHGGAAGLRPGQYGALVRRWLLNPAAGR